MTLRTLIVDTSADFRTIVRLLLQREWPGTQVTEWDPAVKGKPPLDQLDSSVDLVLIGCEPGSSGVTGWTQAALAACKTPVVLLAEESPHAPAAQCPPGSVTLTKRELSQTTLASAVGRSIAGEHASAPSMPPAIDPKATAAAAPVISGIHIVRRLATGGMSTIYLAERGVQREVCALKLLDPALTDDEQFLRRFLDEYALLAKLKTRYVPEIYDQGITDQHVYIAMEYFPNGDLKARLAGGMSPANALKMLQEVAQALVVVHGAGIVHRDLKPDNIMFRADDSLALIDFGIAHESSAQTTVSRRGQVLGTPYYISPEQCLDQPVDGRADIYGLGVIFYEALIGERPFKASTVGGLLHQQVHSAPPALPAHLSRFESLMQLLLAKRPEDRLTAAELVAVLKIDFA